jgi:hypothetical protein
VAATGGSVAERDGSFVHVHPRLLGDRLLRVYPSAATLPDKLVRDRYAETLRAHLV